MSRIPSTINVYDNYDSGLIPGINDAGKEIIPEKTLSQLLIYPKEDCKLFLNGSEKWIYLPKEMWSPISLLCKKFKIAAVSSSMTTEAYWQGWY